MTKLIKMLHMMRISNDELRPVFAKQKYLTQTVELAESLSMELQVCQLESLGGQNDKAK